MKASLNLYNFKCQRLTEVKQQQPKSSAASFGKDFGTNPVADKDKAPANNKNFFAPALFNLQTNSQAFTGRKRIGRKDFILAQYQNKISCPCCGERMHNFNELEARELAKNIASKKGFELARVLKENMYNFQASKRELVEEIIDTAPYYPELNISGILGELSEEYADSLRKKQICIMMDLINEIPDLHPIDKGPLDDWRYQQIKRIMNANEEGEFRNKFLVADFFKMAARNSIPVDRERITKYFDLLPNSKKDTDAFVIKYMRRTAKETAFSLIKNVEPTIEHIVPFYTSKDNRPSNLLVMCSDCNAARGSIPYSDFIAQRPEMLENLDMYFDDIETILHDKMQASKSTRHHYRYYSKDVKRTLANYTNGIVDYGVGER